MRPGRLSARCWPRFGQILAVSLPRGSSRSRGQSGGSTTCCGVFASSPASRTRTAHAFNYCSAQWPSLTSQLRGKDEYLLRQWAADLPEIKFWREILSEKLPAVSPDFQTVAAFLEDLNTVIVSVLALGSGDPPAAGEQSQWIDNVHPDLAFRLQGRPHYL